MIRKLLLLFVSLLFVLTGCAPEAEVPATTSESMETDVPAPEVDAPIADTDAQDVTGETEESGPGAAGIAEDGTYTSRDDVALYLYTYGHLPDNFITKDEARALGWEGGSVEEVAPGKCIGGDYFGNYEELLPEGDYHECDIDTLGKNSRGAKRLIYDDQRHIYYTEDHYESFVQLY